MTTLNTLTINGATNAMEAKILVDAYVSTLTNETAVEILKAAHKTNSYHYFGLRIAHGIGANSYYYGAECKHFSSDIITLAVINKCIDYAKKTQTTIFS